MTIPEVILALSRSAELSMLLKATVLLALALMAVRCTRRSKAAVRHLILASTFAAVAVLPLVIATAPRVQVDIAAPSPKPAQTAAAAQTVATARVAAVIDPSTAVPASSSGWVLPSWTTIMLVLWAGGALLQLGSLGWQLLRLRRIQRAGIPWLEGRNLARLLATESGVRGTVDVLLHEEIPAPVTFGALAPVIML